MNPGAHPLWMYVVAVVITMCIVVLAHWYIAGYENMKQTIIFCAGFLVGMLAMYIAVHLYSWK